MGSAEKPFNSVVEKEALTQLMLNIDPITSFQSNEYNNISIMIQHEHDEESSDNPDMVVTRVYDNSGDENYMSTISEQTTISNSCQNIMNNNNAFIQNLIQ